MNRLAAKLAAFGQAALTQQVRVNVHATPNEPARSRTTDNLVLYACLLAAGAGVGAMAMNDHDRKIATEKQKDREVRGIIVDEPDPGFIRDMQLKRLNYVQVSFGGKSVLTLDETSRIQLSKEAAAAHKLNTMGLSWKDLYGVIHAETNWIPREGIGKNGVASSGLAQLEPATAKSLGVADANDPVEALNASAALLKEAAQWSRIKVRNAGIKSGALFNEKMRDGVSIYYNLSTKARNTWDGRSTAELPVETQRHISNTRQGTRIAARMERELKDRLDGFDWPSAHLQSKAKTQRHNLDGAPDQGLVTTSVFMQLQSEKVFMQNVYSVQQVLQSKCEIKYNTRPSDLARSCLASNPLIGNAISLRQTMSTFPDTYMLGETEGVPVFMARSPEMVAAAIVSLGPDGRPTPGIILSDGLVKEMSGPDLQNRLKFVIGHELGHIRLGHRYVDDVDQITRNELEADGYGFAFALHRGASIDQAAEAAGAVFDIVKRDAPPATMTMTALRAKELGHQVEKMTEEMVDPDSRMYLVQR